MTIKPISYSKSFEMVTPTGLHYWDKISIGADIEAEDNVQECLQVLKKEVIKFQQKSITEYLQEEEKRSKKKIATKPGIEDEVDKEFEKVKKHLATIEFREDAMEYLKTAGFHLSVEAKNIANLKPLKNK